MDLRKTRFFAILSLKDSFPQTNIIMAKEPKKRSKTSEYGAAQITVLEGLEAVRRRPGMYIGNTSTEGLHHMLWEVVDNSIDEAMAGRCDRIDIALLPGSRVSVEDNGAGIPV